MQEQEKPSPHDLITLKGELRARWEQLPPEHQATMVLTLIADVMQEEWGDWLKDAIGLSYPANEQAKHHEQQTRPPVGSVGERHTAFGFTYHENLFDLVGHSHFLELMQDEQTIVHQAEISSNNYGEFLFVTASRPKDDQREVVGFWGLGYHDRRDRYLLDEWHWYVSSLPVKEDEQINKTALMEQIAERRQELEAVAKTHHQSAKGEFYEHLADVTDEDAAATEMDDMGDMLDGLLGE